MNPPKLNYKPIKIQNVTPTSTARAFSPQPSPSHSRIYINNRNNPNKINSINHIIPKYLINLTQNPQKIFT
jgi:hypothetical protein